jgi:hypothetical protein
MTGLASNIYLDRTLKELKFEVRNLHERSTQQSSQIRELYELCEHATSKAELHAAIASLSYKNMGGVPQDLLVDVITQKFKGKISDGDNDFNEKGKRVKTADVPAYLSNPFDAIASLCKSFNTLSVFNHR